MFQRKLHKIFKELPNVFGITHDILVVGYNRVGTDFEPTLHRVF